MGYDLGVRVTILDRRCQMVLLKVLVVVLHHRSVNGASNIPSPSLWFALLVVLGKSSLFPSILMSRFRQFMLSSVDTEWTRLSYINLVYATQSVLFFSDFHHNWMRSPSLMKEPASPKITTQNSSFCP